MPAATASLRVTLRPTDVALDESRAKCRVDAFGPGPDADAALCEGVDLVLVRSRDGGADVEVVACARAKTFAPAALPPAVNAARFVSVGVRFRSLDIGPPAARGEPEREIAIGQINLVCDPNLVAH